MQKLEDFNATNVHNQFMSSNRGGQGDKIRYTFQIENQKQAHDCFQFFYDYEQKQRNNKHKNYKDKKDSHEESKDTQEGKEAFELKE